MVDKKGEIEDIFDQRCKNDSNAANLAGRINEDIQFFAKNREQIIFELLRNANDHSDISLSFKIEIKERYLSVSHTGKAFDLGNVEAICGNTQSKSNSKKNNSNNNDYIGMGFKSVFVFSDAAFIKSGGYTFRFDSSYQKWNKPSQSDLASDYPWQVIPIWTENKDLPHRIANVSPGYNTQFLFKLKKDEIIEDLFQDLKKSLQFMLYLRKIKMISLETCTNKTNNTNNTKICLERTSRDENECSNTESGKTAGLESPKNNTYLKRYEIKKDSTTPKKKTNKTSWLVTERTIDIPEDLQEKLQHYNRYECPQTLKKAKSTRIMFANRLNKKGKITNEAKKKKLFSYFPTNIDLNYPFYIISDFLIYPERRQLLVNEWNLFLFQNIGSSHILSLQTIARNDKKNRNLILDLFEQKLGNNVPKELQEAYKEGVQKALEDTEFIPSDSDPKKLLKFNEAIIDEIEFYKTFSFLDNDNASKIVHHDLKALKKEMRKFSLKELSEKVEIYADECLKKEDGREKYLKLIKMLIGLWNKSESESEREDYKDKKILLANNDILFSSSNLFLPNPKYQKFAAKLQLTLISKDILNIPDAKPCLESLGLKEIQDQIIIEKIAKLLKDGEDIDKDFSIEIVVFLCQFSDNLEIESGKNGGLLNLKLAVTNGSMQLAKDCYLPLEIVFENPPTICHDVNYVSQDYYDKLKSVLEDEQSENLKSTLKHTLKQLGVLETLNFFCDSATYNTLLKKKIPADDLKCYKCYLENYQHLTFSDDFQFHIAYLPYINCLPEADYARIFFQYLQSREKDIIDNIEKFKDDIKKNQLNSNQQDDPEHYLTFMLNKAECIKATNDKCYRMNQLYTNESTFIDDLGEDLGRILPQMQTIFDDCTITLSSKLMHLLGARKTLSVEDAIKLFEAITTKENEYITKFGNIYQKIIISQWDDQDLEKLRKANIELPSTDGSLKLAKSLCFISCPKTFVQPNQYMLKRPDNLTIANMKIICKYFSIQIIDEKSINGSIIKEDSSLSCDKTRQLIFNLLLYTTLSVNERKDYIKQLYDKWRNCLKNINFNLVDSLYIKRSPDKEDQNRFSAKVILYDQDLSFVKDILLKDIIDVLINYLKSNLDQEKEKTHVDVLRRLSCTWDPEDLSKWLEEQMSDSLGSPRNDKDLKIKLEDLKFVNSNEVDNLGKPNSGRNHATNFPIITRERVTSRLSKQPFNQSQPSSIHTDPNKQSPCSIPRANEKQENSEISKASNQEIGKWGEKFAYLYLQDYYKRDLKEFHVDTDGNSYTLSGYDKNDKKVTYKIVWENYENESKKPYDIKITKNGKESYVEVKSTTYHDNASFNITEKEWETMCDKGDNYELFLVYNAGNKREGPIKRIKNLPSKITTSHRPLRLVVKF
ncbi:hypothetical protein TrispH2_003212 [Trichoplax sp. H2]|nr:hypothetical protein TrispH2_003212 [Trichoplax sp. H2]|eukprot:RDD44959.1 hypothetical protein TrispH2_003212 [Trichoplax sp. H2]